MRQGLLQLKLCCICGSPTLKRAMIFAAFTTHHDRKVRAQEKSSHSLNIRIIKSDFLQFFPIWILWWLITQLYSQHTFTFRKVLIWIPFLYLRSYFLKAVDFHFIDECEFRFNRCKYLGGSSVDNSGKKTNKQKNHPKTKHKNKQAKHQTKQNKPHKQNK